MADAVQTNVLANTPIRYVVQLTNLSDGTGESAVTKVDLSTLTGPTGKAVTSLVLEEVQADAAGMSVKVYAARTTPIVIAEIGGLGRYERDYDDVGGIQTKSDLSSTGNILVSTTSASSGDTYDITLFFRKKE